jgi:hypothetical protein
MIPPEHAATEFKQPKINSDKNVYQLAEGGNRPVCLALLRSRHAYQQALTAALELE